MARPRLQQVATGHVARPRCNSQASNSVALTYTLVRVGPHGQVQAATTQAIQLAQGRTTQLD